MKNFGKIALGVVTVMVLESFLFSFADPINFQHLLVYLMKFGVFTIGVGVGLWLTKER